MADEFVSPSLLEVLMLTASRAASGAERRGVAAPARPWTVNAAARRLTGSAVEDARPAAQLDGAVLGSLLVCDGCDRSLQLSWGPDGVRLYVFLCGCHRNEVDADLVERLVRDRVEAASALLVADVPPEGLIKVFHGLFVAVRIGSSAEDLKFVWRI